MTTYTPLPEVQAGDLASASFINALTDNVDIVIGLDEQRNYPFDAGANLLLCDIYGRPTSDLFNGVFVEYWIAHNGEKLTILHGRDTLGAAAYTHGAYLFWNWDGVTYNNPIALIPANTETTITLNATQLSGLVQYQPVRIMLFGADAVTPGQDHGPLYVNYLFQTTDEAPIIRNLPTFETLVQSEAADFNYILRSTEAAWTQLNQPIPAIYTLDNGVGERNGYVGWIRHKHGRVIFDVTITTDGWDTGDYAFLRYNNADIWGWTPGTGNTPHWFDDMVTLDVPAGLTEGAWYPIHFGYNRQNEHAQHVKIWTLHEAPGGVSGYSQLDRWTHGDVLNGDDGSAPLLLPLSTVLGEIDANLAIVSQRWTNQPCRVAGSYRGSVQYLNCEASQNVDGFSTYRVHRWLVYNAFTMDDGKTTTPTLQWTAGNRNMQSVTLPTVDGPAFYDLESTPIKPGMFMRISGVGFAIQVPTPQGVPYA